MKAIIFKRVALLFTFILLVAIAVGCGSKSEKTSIVETTTAKATEATEQVTEASTETTEAPIEVRTINIGIGNAFKPICFVDEDGKLQGYDYETLKKIDELLPQYEFKYDATEFKNILVGLDTKNYDIAAHHFAWNAKRDEKYLYGTVGNFYYGGYTLRIAKGSDLVVNSEEDLGGLKIAVGTASNVAYLSETYNTEHPDNPIDIVYDDGTQEQLLANLNNGVYDGYYGTAFGDTLTKAAFGDVFDVTGEKIFYDTTKANGTYFIYNYGDEQLRDDIDAALQQLTDSGELKDLVIKVVGADYVTKP